MLTTDGDRRFRYERLPDWRGHRDRLCCVWSRWDRHGPEGRSSPEKSAASAECIMSTSRTDRSAKGRSMEFRRSITNTYRRLTGTRPKIVAFDGYAVEVEPFRGSVRVTIHSMHLDVRHVTVSAVDEDGRCLAKQSTNENGTAVLTFPSSEICSHVMVDWPERDAWGVEYSRT